MSKVEIYLVLTDTGTLVSRFIGLFTGAGYNHVSLCLDGSMQEFYSFGRKIIWFPLIGGFVVERIDSGLYKTCAETRCIIYRLEIEDSKYDALKSLVEPFIKNKELYRYNLVGLLGVILKVPMKPRNRYFCTQFVAAMLQQSGVHDFRKDASLVTPEDFYSIPGLSCLYKGKLSDFPSFFRSSHIFSQAALR